MITYKDIIEKCHSEKKKDHNLYYYHRFLSLPFTMLFFKLKVKPDVISISMILLSFVSFGLMIIENRIVFWLGVFISFLAFLFDKIDGDLARLYNVANIKGAVYDFVYHRISLFLFYLGIGIHFSYQNQYMIVVAASCGFIANYIEEMQLLSFRIFAHKYLIKKENIIIPRKLKKIKEPVYIKLLKVFRVQLFLYYILIFAVLLNLYIDNSVFYFTCIALFCMTFYSILQVFYSMKYTFDKDVKRLIKKSKKKNK
mgnify:CR=1 FL=1